MGDADAKASEYLVNVRRFARGAVSSTHPECSQLGAYVCRIHRVNYTLLCD